MNKAQIILVPSTVARQFPHNPISIVISAAGSINHRLYIDQEQTVQLSRSFKKNILMCWSVNKGGEFLSSVMKCERWIHHFYSLADPSRIQGACYIWTQLLSLSFRSSVDRAPAMCSGDHGFDSYRGLRFFSLSHACQCVMLINCILMCRSFC